ncbi:hypothetical protein [Gemmatimonas sp.]
MSALGALALCTGCGPSLATTAMNAMQGCIDVRNPAFVRGDGEQALAIPLPVAVDLLASRTAYKFGLRLYQQAAAEAETQAELTCALELGSRLKSDDTREWIGTFTRHPNAPVANLAKRLMNLQ